ncbi:MAG TPA: hypothetical protein VMI75_34465 [Polyangiaceae bacterium]|nr:hypothetical protein [Polyangiaceae bacterium]
MRTYSVRQGDSPAKIAIEFAGCPKCVADLVAANPQKSSVRYPNGFVTFESLHIGEVLQLPDKWFNGALDALPKEYFDRLPQMPSQSAGVGQAPQPGVMTPGPSASCRLWAYGGSVHVGQTVFMGINPHVSMAAFAQAASFMPEEQYEMEIGGSAYLFKPVTTGPALLRPTPTVQVFYCKGGPVEARPRYMGVGGPPPAPGEIAVPPWQQGAVGSQPGEQAGAPPFIQPPCCTQFVNGEMYSLTVWPIPQGGLINPDPASILTDLGFEVTFSSNNPDGSATVNVIYQGSQPYSPNPSDARSIVVFFGGSPFGSQYVIGETIQGTTTGVQATVTNEFDTNPLSARYGVLTLSNATGTFLQGEILHGITSKAGARVLYQYNQILVSPKSGGMVGLTAWLDQGTSYQLPYDVQPGDNVKMTVRPMTDQSGNMADPTAILVAIGFDASGMQVGLMDPNDCTWPIQLTNTTNQPINIAEQIVDPSTGAMSWVTSMSVNGNVILAPTPPPAPITSPAMSACHAFTLTFIQKQCALLTGGPFDPTDGLAEMGITNFQLSPSMGPDALGQWSIQGVWEMGDGFVLPQSDKIVPTFYSDDGPATNVLGGPCGAGLPYTIQPGDTVNIIARPMAVPGQPMTNPGALLASLGFVNITPAATYSDCTWVMTATWGGSQQMEISDPMMSPNAGGMWVVGLSVNSTVVKEANWQGVQEESIDLTQCNTYLVKFTYDVCPALSGAPGDWDPTSAITALLPGFKVAPGPNEYGEWSATGVWTGASVQALSGSGGIAFTGLIDFGPAKGCLTTPPPCAAGTVADTVTGSCVAPCSDGSSPANGVCPQPAPTTPTTPPVTAGGTGPATTAPTTSSVTTGEVVGVGAGLGALALLGYFLVK